MELIQQLLSRATYAGISKHKRNPRLFGLPPYLKKRADETLCDEHAQFLVPEMGTVRELLARGIRAGLLGATERQGIPTILWTISDNGWIFEARVTNIGIPS